VKAKESCCSLLPVRPLLTLLAVVCTLISSPSTSFAFSDLLVGSLIDDGVSALSRGGLEELPHRSDILDFDSPLFLDSHGKYRLDGFYENQRTLRIFKGRWAGTHAYSDRLETAVAAPFSLYGEKIKGNLSAGYGYRAVNINGENHQENIFFGSIEKFETPKGGIYLRIMDRFNFGAALISDDLRDRLEIPIEAEATLLPYLKLGYKRSYRDFATNVDLKLSGHAGNLPIVNVEEINEVYAAVDYGKALYIKFANELRENGNRRIEGKLTLPGSVYLVGDYAERDFAGIDQEITVDGKLGGLLHGRFKKREYRVGVGTALNDRWSLEANYRHSEISTDGGGIAASSAVASFWPSLLIGNYNYLYSAALSSNQYHLGACYQGERFSFGTGFQYLDLKPLARLDYWRSAFLGLGRAGEDEMHLTTDRVGMLFLSFGVGYQWQQVALRYAFGQFIPISSHDTEDEQGQSASSGGGGGGDIFSSIADKINHNPGGNVQRLLLTVTF
jgi:hypothetical protein